MGKSISLNKKTILIAGCYGDFAKEISLTLIEAGAKLILIGKSKEKFLAKYADCDLDFLEPLFHICDLTNEEEIIKLKNKIDPDLKNLYGIVNCVAYQAYTKSIFETDYNSWKEGIDVDINSVFLTIKYFGSYLVDNKLGSIVNFTSFHNIGTYPNRVLYNTCKSAVEGLTRSIAVELGQYNIRANAVAPGPIFSTRTRFFLDQNPEVKSLMLGRTPLYRIGELEDIAGLVLFLLSSYSKHITGQQHVIDGGWSVNTWFETFKHKDA